MERGDFIENIIDQATLEVKWGNVWQIPEFKVLLGTEQNPYWHSEGNVSVHTENVVSEVYKLCPLGADLDGRRKRYVLVLAALFHDIGKGVTTKWNEDKGCWTSDNHAAAGEKITRRLLWDCDMETREMVCSLVGNHMKPLYVHGKVGKEKNVIKLAEEPVPLEWLLTLKRADCLGAKSKEADGWEEKLQEVRSIAERLGCLTKPYQFPSLAARYEYFSNWDATEINHDADDGSDFRIYVLIGLPGSGKTTYRNKVKLPCICRDDIRAEIGLKGDKPMGNKEQEEEVTWIAEKRMLGHAERGESFIIDATNLKRKYRQGFNTMFAKYKPKMVYIYFEADKFQDNLDRRKGQISETVIRNMQCNFDYPKLTECYNFIVYKGGRECHEE